MRQKKNRTGDLISPLNLRGKHSSIGNKAANIQRLASLGMRVPVTHVLTWEAHRRYMEDDLTVVDQALAELNEKLDPTMCYAVRSSANIEDSFEHSFAGQFKTVLNVQGSQALMQAIWSIWATAKTREVEEYLRKRSLSDTALRMAILLQEMVRPVFSGVSFSRNPLTGLRETVVEAVEGLGTALVQEGLTPYRWTYVQGAYTSRPEQTPIPQEVIQQVVDGTRSVSRKLRRDVDMEWVYDGQNLHWVQMREITSLNNIEVYSNRLSREMLAGMIKPLIWSINIPMMTGNVIRILTDLIGPNDLTADRLVHSFYYRAYFNMGLLGTIFEKLGFPAESLEMMWGINEKASNGQKSSPAAMKPPMNWQMLRLVPNVLRFAWDKWTLPARLSPRLDEIETTFRAVDVDGVRCLSPKELIDAVDRLYVEVTEAAYYNKVVPLTMYVYNSVLRKQLGRLNIDFTRLDMRHNLSDFDRYDPNPRLADLHKQFVSLPPDLKELISRCPFCDLVVNSHLDGFTSGVQQLMHSFGHLCDNGNDFSTIPWRENSDTILKLIVDYADRPGAETGSANSKLRFEDLHLPWMQRLFLKGLYERARRFTLYREQISYIYSFGYGLFRIYFLALGQHMVNQGLLASVEDVFYLSSEEIRQLVNVGGNPADIQARVAAHKREIERVRNVVLPTVIYGTQPPPVEENQGSKLVGTPTSRGYCTGRVKVVTGLQDFPKVQPGDILVIPFSDVGWTPLFARASGIIAESGGLLSHSSIVAREYGIPAIVSVAGATGLPDGVLVSMDGYKGEVFILEESEIGEEEIASIERK